MLVSRLFRSLLRFFSMGIVPDEGGGAPAIDVTPAAPAPADQAPAAAAPVAEPADPSAGLRSIIDSLGNDPAADVPGQPRDSMGRFAPVDLAATPAPAPAAQAPAAAPVTAPAAATPAASAAVPPTPKPGEVDLTPPEGMTPRAQERWAQLTERVKQVPMLEQRATEATTALESVRKLVTDSGLAPPEFTEMLDMARLYKSNSPQDAQRALQMLDGLRQDLATRFGLEAPGVDPLANHPDLKGKVDGMLLSHEDALEIARLRTQGQQAQQVTQEQREMQQYQQTINQASVSMDRALQAKASTPGHQAKLEYIHGHFSNPENLNRFVKTYRPEQWESVMLTMYEAYTPPQVPAPVQAAAPAAPAAPQPLRPGGLRSGAQVQTGPVTAESALTNAFAAAGL